MYTHIPLESVDSQIFFLFRWAGISHIICICICIHGLAVIANPRPRPPRSKCSVFFFSSLLRFWTISYALLPLSFRDPVRMAPGLGFYLWAGMGRMDISALKGPPGYFFLLCSSLLFQARVWQSVLIYERLKIICISSSCICQ